MPPRILLADDSVTVQKVIELTFSDEGIEVTAVGDGRQAIEQIDAAPPDVVLADVSMPERDGYEVAAHVKQTPALAHIPVVLMTGAFEQLDEARARSVGCDGVLAKPFEPQMVITMVRELLAQRANLDAMTALAASPDAPGTTDAGAAEGFPFEPGTAAGRTPRTLDDFFDRIDEALAAAPPPPPQAPDGPAPISPALDARPAGPVDSPAAPAKGAEPDSASPLAAAFSELLADELGEATFPSSWNAVAPVAAPSALAGGVPALSEDVLEEVARRAAAHVSRELIREEVSRQVLDVAERLVREEIARLKS